MHAKFLNILDFLQLIKEFGIQQNRRDNKEWALSSVTWVNLRPTVAVILETKQKLTVVNLF